MFNEKFLQVLSQEGPLAIVTWNSEDAHVVSTWTSYVNIKEENQLLIPAAGMKKTQANINVNDKVKLTLASKEVQGHYGMGAGFVLEGNAEFITSGETFDMMKEKFPFLTRVLAVTVSSLKQTV